MPNGLTGSSTPRNWLSPTSRRCGNYSQRYSRPAQSWAPRPDGCGGCVLFYMDQVTLISWNVRGLNTRARRDVVRMLVNDTRALALWKGGMLGCLSGAGARSMSCGNTRGEKHSCGSKPALVILVVYSVSSRLSVRSRRPCRLS
jgi:hypothetical protein